MKMFLVVALLGFSFPAFSNTSYILGGQQVDPPDPIGQITVGVFGPSPDSHAGSLCTGTLIRRDMVLTAAHCIPPNGTKPVVIFGSDIHTAGAVERPAKAVAVNPAWVSHAGRGMDQGDIALIQFAGGKPSGFKTASMVKSDAEIHAGENVTLAGYGISDANDKSGAGKLRKTDVRIVKNRPGQSEMIVDQSHGRGACHGDSGGPAFLNRNGKVILAGVTNRGYPGHAPDDCAHQAVYTKVPSYRPWIRDSEKKMDSSNDQQGLLKATRVGKPLKHAKVGSAKGRHTAMKTTRKTKQKYQKVGHREKISKAKPKSHTASHRRLLKRQTARI